MMYQKKQYKEVIEYTVVKGDTLASIAFKHKVSIRYLMNTNHLLNDIVIPGEVMYIPVLENLDNIDRH